MISNFSKSLDHVLQAEGGFTDDPRDAGNHLSDGRAGCTNMGVTQAAWEEYVGHKVSTADMKALTKEQVGKFYKNRYWDRVQADSLPVGIDFLAFSFAINAGVGSSAKLIQKAINVIPDGMIGPRTIQTIAGFDPKELVEKFSEAKEHYYSVLKTFPIYGKGWLNRVASEKTIALSML
jgi:lysozyme family protein